MRNSKAEENGLGWRRKPTAGWLTASVAGGGGKLRLKAAG